MEQRIIVFTFSTGEVEYSYNILPKPTHICRYINNIGKIKYFTFGDLGCAIKVLKNVNLVEMFQCIIL